MNDRDRGTAPRTGNRLRPWLEKAAGGLAALRRRPGRGAFGDAAGGVKPENLVWIFCIGRSGSTWLASMMGDLGGSAMWNEPLVGALFGQFYYIRAAHRRNDKAVIMGGHHRDVWLGGIRSMVLEGATARYPDLPDDGSLIVKEPNGSIGAPLLVEALPESRVILLVRDPRDVTASALDAHRRGGWHSERVAPRLGRENAERQAEADPDAFVERHARRCLQDIGKAREAYDSHTGRKALVRYEDLRADALGTMLRLYSALGIPVDEKELARVVQKHAWEAIPDEKKGAGKFYRKASPGGWRKDLTAEQAATVESITAPLLAEFYPEGA